MSDDRSTKIFYGRTITSVVLYVAFMILSVNAVLANTLHEQPFLLGGLLIGAVLLLPRTPRRPGRGDDQEPTREEARRSGDIQKWLTGVRIAYFVIAVLLWFGLPEII